LARFGGPAFSQVNPFTLKERAMKQLYFACLIRRDAVETVSREAASTEVPVLQHIYGDALTLVEGGQSVANRDPITPAEEFERLVKRYGPDAVMGAYGNRTGAEREIAHLFADGAKAAAALPADQVTPAGEIPFLARKADAVIAEIVEQEDGALADLLANEKEHKARKTVIAAIEAEIAARAAEDAATGGAGQ
jgi:hypothetical protein